MKKLQILALLACGLAACNDEVFLKPLTVEPESHTLEWTGGQADFTANQEIDYVYSIIYRWINGRGYPVDNSGMQYTIGRNDRIHIQNDLCDITLANDQSGRLIIESGYNLYPDTIYMNIDISTPYETAPTRGLRILPSPGFAHGDITYELSQCWWEEHCDTIQLYHMGFFGEQPLDFTAGKKGKAVARSAAQFKPYEKLLSDNIFGREPFEVDEVVIKGYDWGLSGRKIPYTSNPQYTGDSLVFNEDIIVTLQPDTEYRIKAVIKSEQWGFNYSLPAISPVAGLKDKMIDGVFWIMCPMSYDILVETNDIK